MVQEGLESRSQGLKCRAPTIFPGLFVKIWQVPDSEMFYLPTFAAHFSKPAI